MVIPPPVAGTISGPDSVCVGASISLTETVSGTEWTMLNGKASVTGTGVVLGASAGYDTVVFTITNYCGLVYTMKQIYVNTLPDPGTIIGKDSLCVGVGDTLLETSIYGSWSATNGNATVIPIMEGGLATGLSAGVDTIMYNVTNGCGTTHDTMTVVINAPLAPPVISGTTYVCVGGRLDTLSCSPTGGVWSSANDLIALVIGDTAIGVNPGLTTISYTLSNFCGSVSAVDTIQVYSMKQCDSIDSALNFVPELLNPGGKIIVYPNPTSGQFAVSLPANLTSGALEIADMVGKTIMRRPFSGNSNPEFDLTGVADGNYIVQITSGTTVYRTKLELRH